MNTTCDNWWILQVFLFLPERSAFGIIGSGSWYIEGGEKFEGEGRKGLLSQGGWAWATTTLQLYLISIAQPPKCSLFTPQKNVYLQYTFLLVEKDLWDLREVGAGWGGVGRSVIARRPRRQYITTTLHTWWALRTIQLFSLLPPKYHFWWK